MTGKHSVTAFEQEVYKAVRKIPRGQITTYQAIAQAIRRPRSARAVGNALHKNPFAPRVPCHRVIRSDGRIGGFAGGPKKKAKLLKKEGAKIYDNKIDSWREINYYPKV